METKENKAFRQEEGGRLPDFLKPHIDSEYQVSKAIDEEELEEAYEDDEEYLDEEEYSDDDSDEEEDDSEDAEEIDEEEEEYLDVSPEEEEVQGDGISPRDELERSWQRVRQLPLNWKVFVGYAFVLIVCASMWNTYYNQLMRRVTDKEKELMDLRYRMLYTTAELVKLERINNIEERITELNLPLEHSTQPPYELLDTLSVNEEK